MSYNGCKRSCGNLNVCIVDLDMPSKKGFWGFGDDLSAKLFDQYIKKGGDPAALKVQDINLGYSVIIWIIIFSLRRIKMSQQFVAGLP